ncbi:hypothetical protein AB0I34_42545 [Kribbella sp. NPDC050281]|uniref:hypothetical protein n=1 Tax=Kribbella sp. NPDC050281 TaxID=3155515 RepID=UPI0033ED319E
MRVIRSILGVLIALLGLVVAAAGGAAAFWLVGPDNTVHAGEQHLTSKGLAIVSAPTMLDRHGPVLHVDVRSTAGKPVFVGVARGFDTTSYLKNIAHTELVQVEYPATLKTEEVKGTAGPVAAPGTLDWWVAKATGPGTQKLAWKIEDGPYSVVIMSADGKTAPDVQADLGIEIPNAFLSCLAVFVIGLVLLALGIFMVLFRRRRTSTPAPPVAAQGEVEAPAPRQPSQVGPVRRVAAVTGVLALVSGCSAIPQTNTVNALTRPAITSETAAAVIKHYNEVNNAANKRRDDRLIATVEGGNLVRESQAGYAIDRALDKTGKDIIKPFTYTKPVVGAPEYGGYPMRFVATAGISDTKDYRHLGVWERKTAGSQWLLTFAAAPKTTVKLPDLAGVRPITAADSAKLVATPPAAVKALTEYLNAGAKSPRAASFAPNADISAVLKDIADDKAHAVKQPQIYHAISYTFSSTEAPIAFQTKAGSALVFMTLTEHYVLQVGKGYNFNWASGASIAFSPPTAKYYNALTSESTHDVAVLIPPKGKGKMQIFSHESQLLTAGGY